jgi:NAD(P)-dependent dehydrogenase (short-subunit alcohol dehydrogenase family)
MPTSIDGEIEGWGGGKLEGKLALVTGAAGTMGLAASRALLREGATVIMADVSQERLNGLAR